MPTPIQAAQRLAVYINDPDRTGGSEYVRQCAAEAEAMLGGYLTPENVRSEPPEHVRERALLEVGADLYYRKTSRNGIASMDGSPEGITPLRIARDPMRACYEILRPYMKPALA